MVGALGFHHQCPDAVPTIPMDVLCGDPQAKGGLVPAKWMVQSLNCVFVPDVSIFPFETGAGSSLDWSYSELPNPLLL